MIDLDVLDGDEFESSVEGLLGVPMIFFGGVRFDHMRISIRAPVVCAIAPATSAANSECGPPQSVGGST